MSLFDAHSRFVQSTAPANATPHSSQPPPLKRSPHSPGRQNIPDATGPRPQGFYIPKWSCEESTIETHHKAILKGTNEGPLLKLAEELFLINRVSGESHPLFQSQFLNLDPLIKDITVSDDLLTSMIQVCALFQFSMPALVIGREPPIPQIILDRNQNLSLLLLVKDRGTGCLLKLPFRPQAALDSLARCCAERNAPEFISLITEALIPPHWRCLSAETTLQGHADKINIDFGMMRCLARSLLNHQDKATSALGCRLMFLGMCHPCGPGDSSLRENMTAIFSKLPGLLATRRTREERIAFLTNLGTALDHSLDSDFTKNSLYASLSDFSQEPFDPEDYFWNLAALLCRSNHEILQDLALELVEQEINPGSNMDRLGDFLMHARQMKNFAPSDLLRIISKIEHLEILPAGRQLDLVIMAAAQMRNQPHSPKTLLDLYRLVPYLHRCIARGGAPENKEDLHEVLRWIVPKMCQHMDPVGLGDTAELLEACIEGGCLTPLDEAMTDIVLSACRTFPAWEAPGAAKLWRTIFPKWLPAHKPNESQAFLSGLVVELYGKQSPESVALADEILVSFEHDLNSHDSLAGIVRLRKAKLKCYSNLLNEKRQMEELVELLPSQQGSPAGMPELNRNEILEASPGVFEIGEMIKFARAAETPDEKKQCRLLIGHAVQRQIEKANSPGIAQQDKLLVKTLLREEMREVFKSDPGLFEHLLLGLLNHVLRLNFKENINPISEIFDTLNQDVLTKTRPPQSPGFYAALAHALRKVQSGQAGSIKMPKPFSKAAKAFISPLLQRLQRANLPKETLPVLSLALGPMLPQEIPAAADLRECLFWCSEELFSSNHSPEENQLAALSEVILQAEALNLLPIENQPERQFKIAHNLFQALVQARRFDLSLTWLSRLENHPSFKGNHAQTLGLLLKESENCIKENADNILAHLQHECVRRWGSPGQLQRLFRSLVQHYMASMRYGQCAKALAACHWALIDSGLREECSAQAQRVCLEILREKDPKNAGENALLAIKLLGIYALDDSQLWQQAMEAAAACRDHKIKQNACSTFLAAAGNLPISPKNRQWLAECWKMAAEMLIALQSKEILRLLENSCPIHLVLEDVSQPVLRSAIYATLLKRAVALAASEDSATRLALTKSIVSLWEKHQPDAPEDIIHLWAAVCPPLLDLCAAADGLSPIEFQCALIEMQFKHGSGPQRLAFHVERLLICGSKSATISLTEQECLVDIAILGRTSCLKDLDHVACAEALIKLNCFQAALESALMLQSKFLSKAPAGLANSSQRSKPQKDRIKTLIIELLAREDAAIVETVKATAALLRAGDWLDANSMACLHHFIIYHMLTHCDSDSELVDALEYFHANFQRAGNMAPVVKECLLEVLKSLPHILLQNGLTELFIKLDVKMADILEEMIEMNIHCPSVYKEYFDYLKMLIAELALKFDDADPVYVQMVEHMYIIPRCRDITSENLIGLFEDLALCIPPSHGGIPKRHQEKMVKLLKEGKVIQIFRGNQVRYYALAMYFGHYFIANKRIEPETEGKGLKHIVARLCEEGTPEHWTYALRMLIGSLERLIPKHSEDVLYCYRHLLDECLRSAQMGRFQFLCQQAVGTVQLIVKLDDKLAVNLITHMCQTILASCAKLDTEADRLKMLHCFASFIYHSFKIGVFEKNDTMYVLLIRRLLQSLKEIDRKNGGNRNATKWFPGLLLLINPLTAAPLINNDDRIKLIQEWVEHYKPSDYNPAATLSRLDCLRMATVTQITEGSPSFKVVCNAIYETETAQTPIGGPDLDEDDPEVESNSTGDDQAENNENDPPSEDAKLRAYRNNP